MKEGRQLAVTTASNVLHSVNGRQIVCLSATYQVESGLAIGQLSIRTGKCRRMGLVASISAVSRIRKR